MQVNAVKQWIKKNPENWHTTRPIRKQRQCEWDFVPLMHPTGSTSATLVLSNNTVLSGAVWAAARREPIVSSNTPRVELLHSHMIYTHKLHRALEWSQCKSVLSPCYSADYCWTSHHWCLSFSLFKKSSHQLQVRSCHLNVLQCLQITKRRGVPVELRVQDLMVNP